MIDGGIKLGPPDIRQLFPRPLVLDFSPSQRRIRLRRPRVPYGEQFHAHIIVRDQQPGFVFPDGRVRALILDRRAERRPSAGRSISACRVMC